MVTQDAEKKEAKLFHLEKTLFIHRNAVENKKKRKRHMMPRMLAELNMDQPNKKKVKNDSRTMYQRVMDEATDFNHSLVDKRAFFSFESEVRADQRMTKRRKCGQGS